MDLKSMVPAAAGRLPEEDRRAWRHLMLYRQSVETAGGCPEVGVWFAVMAELLADCPCYPPEILVDLLSEAADRLPTEQRRTWWRICYTFVDELAKDDKLELAQWLAVQSAVLAKAERRALAEIADLEAAFNAD